MLRWAVAVTTAVVLFLLVWWGLTAGWHWSRGDAFGLAAVPLALVLAVLGWWAALPGKADEISEHLAGGTADGPGSRIAPVRFGNIPIALRVMEPREELLTRLRMNSVAGPVTVVCGVTGLRGVGKTQLAAQYARDRIDAGWALVAWIDAEDAVQMIGQLVSLAERLGLRWSHDEDSATVTDRLRDWLQARTEPGLLVFDNATDPDAVAPHLPATGSTHIVITSTVQAFAVLGESIPVHEFTAEQATGFLARATGLDDPAGAKIVAEELGRLPLALSHAAALITGQRLDYGTYLQRLRALPLTDFLIRPDGHPYARSTASAVLLSLAAVEDEDPTGLCRSVMELLGVLAPTGVRRQLLYQALLGKEMQCGPADGDGRRGTVYIRVQQTDGQAEPSAIAQVDEAIARLVQASLVTFNDSGGTLTTHRLVMRIVRERSRVLHRLRPITRTAVGTLTQDLTALGQNTWSNRTAIAELVSHTTALWEHTHNDLTGGIGSGRELGVELLGARIRGLQYLLEIKDPGRAIHLGTDLLATSRRVLGEDHLDTLRCLNALALAYRQSGRLDEAVPMSEQAFAGRVRVLGPDHPDTLQSLNNLALAYREAGRLDEAILTHKQTLAARVRVLGPDHPDTLHSRNNLAFAYRRAGRLDDAISMAKQTLAARERVLGPDHPDTLQSRGNLAGAYRDAGRLDEATQMSRQAFAGRVRVLGPDHPDTLQSLNNLALAYREAGRLDEAIPMFERALATRERVLGPDHPDTLQSRGNLAGAYRDAGRLEEAIALHQQTLTARERVLGPDHPDTLRSRSNLASAYREAGRLDEAVPMFEETLAARERVLGPGHPDTLRSRSNLESPNQEADGKTRS